MDTLDFLAFAVFTGKNALRDEAHNRCHEDYYIASCTVIG